MRQDIEILIRNIEKIYEFINKNKQNNTLSHVLIKQINTNMFEAIEKIEEFEEEDNKDTWNKNEIIKLRSHKSFIDLFAPYMVAFHLLTDNVEQC
jgi:hypothetical protein